MAVSKSLLKNKNIVYSDIHIDIIKQQDGDIKQDSDVDAIKNSISNICNTRKGERRMLAEFGCDFDSYLFEQMTESTAYNVGRELNYAIERWEPRVIISDINVIANLDDNAYYVNITFLIKSISVNAIDTQNMQIILRLSS